MAFPDVAVAARISTQWNFPHPIAVLMAKNNHIIHGWTSAVGPFAFSKLRCVVYNSSELFLTFINDLPDALTECFMLFADDTVDTKIYSTISIGSEFQITQSDLHFAESIAMIKWVGNAV